MGTVGAARYGRDGVTELMGRPTKHTSASVRFAPKADIRQPPIPSFVSTATYAAIRSRKAALISCSRERRQFRDVASIVLDDDRRFHIFGDLLEAVE